MQTELNSIPIDSNGVLINPITGEPLFQSLPTERPEPIRGLEPTKELLRSRIPSRYEVRPDSFFVVKFGLLTYDDRIIVIDHEHVASEELAETHWCKFRMWTYKEELEWKNKSTEFDAERRIHTLNYDRLNEFKIRNLLVDWSFSEYELDKKLLHVNGYMSDESYKFYTSMYPMIIKYITNHSNEILENNG